VLQTSPHGTIRRFRMRSLRSDRVEQLRLAFHSNVNLIAWQEADCDRAPLSQSVAPVAPSYCRASLSDFRFL